MNDTQFYVLVTVLGGGLAAIGAAIRFSISRVIKAIDSNSKAMIDNTASNSVLSTKIDSIADFVQKRERERDSTPVEGVPITRGGQYSKTRRKTEAEDK